MFNQFSFPIRSNASALVGLLISVLPASVSADEALTAIEVLFTNRIIHRDSGTATTKEYLSHCLENTSASRFVLDCDDVLYTHYISFFYGDQNVIVITVAGSSVESRYVFEARNTEYTDVTKSSWPKISANVISRLLAQNTGDDKYTENYVLAAAHSNYRVLHRSTDTLIVVSGIPDQSFGMKLGVFRWNGHAFIFEAIRSQRLE